MPSYKKLVLARFPNAKPAITSFWRDGTPRHVTIIAGNERLERLAKNADWWNDNGPQSHVRAWREAYLWCLAHPGDSVQSDLFDKA